MRKLDTVRIVGGCAICVFSALPAAAAVIPADSADDVCPPTADPCIVDQKYEATSGSLDFGDRTVRIVPGGQFLKSLSLSCGDLDVQVGNSVAFDTQEGGGEAGSLDLYASGTITLNGRVISRGDPGGVVRIEADGDVVVGGRILADGSPIGTDGGSIIVSSYEGSVTINERLVSKSTKGGNYEPPSGGSSLVTAAYDITINGEIQAGGGDSGGHSDIDADGSLVINAGIDVSAGGGLWYGKGGYSYIYSSYGILFDGPTTGARHNADGTGGTYISYGYRYPYPGDGGLHYIRNDESGNVEVTNKVSFFANGGPNAGSAGSQGGWLYFNVYGGDLTFDGNFSARGSGRYGYGGYLFANIPYQLDVGSSSSIELRGKTGGTAYLDGYYGTRMDGTIDVRGHNKAGNGEYSDYGSGGTVSVKSSYGDLDLGGHVLQGADGGSQDIEVEACRLRMANTGLLSAKHGAPLGGGSVYIFVEESVDAAAGSRILADAQGGGSVEIDYGNPNKPPTLDGTIEPAPDLNAFLGGCPVCGNDEIDVGESCDDGNLDNGDGCNDECQDEGCIAQTSGYPSTPLCDDSNACTLNVCNSTTHQCSNPVSCADGIACTEDACGGASCTHTPNDALCDDYNECTDDMCSPSTGCVHASLDAVPCEDGDLCTVTGDCASGNCVTTDGSYATGNSIKLRFSDADDDDRLSYKGVLPLSELTANAAVTGMAVELRDGNNLTLIGGLIPASAFEDKKGTGEKVSFRDKKHTLETGDGIVQISIKKVASSGVAKVKIKARDTDLSGADGAFRLSLSMLFGGDPATDDCLTARYVPCEPGDGKNKCTDS